MALIPKPLDKLITIATRLPKVIEFAKTSATVKDGNLGILVAVGGVVASKKIAKAQEYAKRKAEEAHAAASSYLDDLKTKSAEELGLTEEEANHAIKVSEELVARLDQTMKEGLPFTEEEVMEIIDEEIEKVKPPILSTLAAPHKLIGIPVFLNELLNFLNAADPFVSAGVAAPQIYVSDMKPDKLDADPSLKVDTSNVAIPEFAEWGAPPDEKSPIKKDGKQWWWTVPPQLPVAQGEGDWTRQKHGGLGSKDAHKRFMKRRYDQ